MLTILDDPLDVNEIAGSGLKLDNILDGQFAQLRAQIHYWLITMPIDLYTQWMWAKIKNPPLHIISEFIYCHYVQNHDIHS